jgi:hypothetical protein
MYCIHAPGFSGPRESGKWGWQNEDIGPLHGVQIGHAATEAHIVAEGTKLRQQTQNHYLFIVNEQLEPGSILGRKKRFYLMNGKVPDLPMLKYANDVHGTDMRTNMGLKSIGKAFLLPHMIATRDIPCAADDNWGRIGDAELLWDYRWSETQWSELIHNQPPAIDSDLPLLSDFTVRLIRPKKREGAGVDEDVAEAVVDEDVAEADVGEGVAEADWGEGVAGAVVDEHVANEECYIPRLRSSTRS